MNFSTNQVRQFYAVKSYSATAVTDASPVGAVSVHSDKDGALYFLYRGVDGVSRTDLITNINYAKATDAEKLARPLKKVTVALDSNVNSGNLVVGQDYLFNVFIRNYIGLGEEDQYHKYAVVRATTGMTTSEFYVKLAMSFVANLSREYSKLFKVYVRTAAAVETEVLPTTDESTLNAAYTAISIEEAEQEWKLGMFESTPINFQVLPSTITVAPGDDPIWGVVTSITPTSTVKNGKITADLEYFAMGERGDKYRMVGFPDVVETTYIIDPALEYNYLDIHYSYLGNGIHYYKSEKDITLAFPKVGVTNSVSNALANSVIGAINSELSMSIPTLDATGD